MRRKTKTQGRYQLKSEWAYKCKSTIFLMFQTNNDITFSCLCLVVGTTLPTKEELRTMD